MSAYYTGSNNQKDATPMLYLREPLPSSYPEAPVLPGNMMMYMNSGSYSDALAGSSQQQNNCIDVVSSAGLQITIHSSRMFYRILVAPVLESRDSVHGGRVEMRC
ncbi:BEL1-like homeodomain protein 7 [Prunus yedoensis var. nudiflora]|uniref:BEL1-like homeodomain protein 7 n=1 Tax=Prunus yedoensis var. nudiflora TaxID=2094558 RepID=A0A314UEJ7_PRUYE|nr:BEL1-like homeodomain protein 7 [Prunus yedoensis var. nudiflora]